ncbi:sensor histidine kinase [Cellulomonas wangsupingiae]|uniref:Oxygen sensor histidine kinase NreB n=1 Tax=Cellulomonas wangsupingiae TaxID=2968085 RepID=A0ABY5K1A9_9CELL|nr:sensor histidine kinase [Cellulomonas wangsupingiae]MCC2336703.1 sensor histidine kinase [Cellulomonas wangsupingiae]UUI64227.1 sensor histidine kinase [Cellulomonas wangsupingiae]
MSTPADAGAGTEHGPGPQTVDRHGFWLRTLRMWDLVFVGLTALYLVAVLTEVSTPADALLPAGAMAVLVLTYVLVGRRGVVRGDTRRVDAYLAVLVVVVVSQVALADIGPVLLFLAYVQIWNLVRTRVAGVVWAVALAVGCTVAEALRVRGTDEQIVEIAAQFGSALLFAVALGLWITHVAEQSEERAYLLDELRATQDALAASHHAAGVVAERERLAAEIHDTLAQGFTSVVMLAQTASVELERGRSDRVAARLAGIEDVARDNLAEARALVAAFSPPDLQDGTLADALARLATRFTGETGVRVEVVDDAGDDLAGREAQVVLLRAAQEALANVRRHAAASHVTLRLARSGDEVVLEVADDGRGLPAGASEGTGLRGMRARADAAGGTLDVVGTPGDGTRVRLRVPVRPAAAGTTGPARTDAP